MFVLGGVIFRDFSRESVLPFSTHRKQIYTKEEKRNRSFNGEILKNGPFRSASSLETGSHFTTKTSRQNGVSNLMIELKGNLPEEHRRTVEVKELLKMDYY